MNMSMYCIAKSHSWRVILHNSHESSDPTSVQALQGFTMKILTQANNFLIQWHHWNLFHFEMHCWADVQNSLLLFQVK